MQIEFLKVKEASGYTIHSALTVITLMTAEAKIDRECLWVLHLNAANRIIEKELVSVGSVNSAIIHPREVFKKAILNGATGIITIHNHPSGQVQPSKEDRAMWERLDDAGKILGIPVLDHLIITPSGRWYSRKEGEQKGRKEDRNGKECEED